LTITDPNGGSIYGSVSSSRAQLCPNETAADIETKGSAKSRINDYFNSAAFCAAPVIGDGTGYGNSSVGTVRGPSQDNTDLTLSRNFGLFAPMENNHVEFRAEFFNAFNHAQFADPLTALGPGFGQLTSSSVAPRIIQFALKYQF
jgi:hypothetical protein